MIDRHLNAKKKYALDVILSNFFKAIIEVIFHSAEANVI